MISAAITSGIANEDVEGDAKSSGGGFVRIASGTPADAEQVAAVVAYRWDDPAAYANIESLASIMEVSESDVWDTVTGVDFSPVHQAMRWIEILDSTFQGWPFLHGDLEEPLPQVRARHRAVAMVARSGRCNRLGFWLVTTDIPSIPGPNP